jgi:dihydrofolate reductase
MSLKIALVVNHFRTLLIMRKIILNVAVSMDGYIEDQNGKFDWCFTDQDYGMLTFLNNTDSIFLGRKSYELLIKMGDTMFADKTKYVFSRSLRSLNAGYELIGENWKADVENLKKERGKNIWLFGGADLLNSFLKENFVDEMWLAVHPVLLGGGKSLFKDLEGRKMFELKEVKTYSSGLVQTFYKK